MVVRSHSLPLPPASPLPPSSVDVSSGDTSSAGFTMEASADTTAGALDISVALTGTASNIGTTPLTVATSASNKLTVVDGPSTVTLSVDTFIVEGGVASSSVTFSLDVAADGGEITLTPTATGITFTPSFMDVSSVNTQAQPASPWKH